MHTRTHTQRDLWEGISFREKTQTTLAAAILPVLGWAEVEPEEGSIQSSLCEFSVLFQGDSQIGNTSQIAVLGSGELQSTTAEEWIATNEQRCLDTAGEGVSWGQMK